METFARQVAFPLLLTTMRILISAFLLLLLWGCSRTCSDLHEDDIVPSLDKRGLTHLIGHHEELASRIEKNVDAVLPQLKDLASSMQRENLQWLMLLVDHLSSRNLRSEYLSIVDMITEIIVDDPDYHTRKSVYVTACVIHARFDFNTVSEAAIRHSVDMSVPATARVCYLRLLTSECTGSGERLEAQTAASIEKMLLSALNMLILSDVEEYVYALRLLQSAIACDVIETDLCCETLLRLDKEEIRTGDDIRDTQLTELASELHEVLSSECCHVIAETE